MHELYELKDRLCEELEEYKDKNLDKTNLDVIDKLSHTIKNLGKIIEQKEEEDGYSNMNGGYYDGHSYARNSYEGGRGHSYARGRGRYAKRDSMGRYSSERGYSYDDEMMSELHKLMKEAPDERTRQEFKRFIDKIETM